MVLKKNIQDFGYIAVGAGVIGFQQAQVARRELTARVRSTAQGARSCVGSQVDTTHEQLTGHADQVRNRITDQAGLVRDQIGISVTSATGSARDVVARTTWEGAMDLSRRAAGLADNARELVDPVVIEIKVRVDPIVNQLGDVPGRLSRVVTMGSGRVLTIVSSEPAA